MSTSLYLKMPYMSAAQAQKEVTHNEALAILDAVVQMAVEDRNLTTPPGTAAEGQIFLVATAGATDAWTGYSGYFAHLYNSTWRFYAPSEGWRAWIKDEDLYTIYTGSSWMDGDRSLMSVYPPSTHGEYSGERAMLPFGTAVNFSHAVFCDSSGQYQLAAAGSTATVPCVGLVVTSASSGAVGGVLKRGYICNTAWNWTKGKTLYLSTVAGALTESPSTAAGNQIQVVGIAHTSVCVDVLPSLSVSEAG